jgi:choline dehydrogenase-like flavoprotein
LKSRPRFDPSILPGTLGVGLAEDILETPDGARHFDGFSSVRGLKGDAENRLLAATGDTVEVVTGTEVTGLIASQLRRLGYLPVAKPIPRAGTAHACRTLVAGTDPRSSVVDAEGRVHGVENVYVVDGSVLPRSSRVNPALSIYAWALRVGERLAGATVTEAPRSEVAA